MDQMRFQRGLMLGLLGWMLVLPVTSQAQFGAVRQPTEDLLLMAPRSLTRLLREGEVAIAEGRFADAVSALGAVLLDDSGDLPADLRGQDFFVETGTRGLLQKSAKGEAIRLLSGLPPEGRQTLEIQFGVTARNELDKAIAASDMDRISDVARRYVHTEAGYDAQVLIAQVKLATGYPLAAASILQNLLDYPAARSRYGVQLVQATAMAMLQADQVPLAAATLQMAARDFPNSSLTIGGQQIALRPDTDWGPVLAAQLAKSKSLTSNATVDSWLTSGGSAQRSAVATAGLPLSSARWVKEIHSSVPERDALLEVEEVARKTGNVILPKFELRMVDGTIITKTTDARVIGIDFETGNVSWEHYFGSSAAPLRNFASGRSYVGDELVSQELQKRVWGSTAFGRVSCDQNNFYYISSQGEQPIDPNRLLVMAVAGRDSNYLEGVSIAAQGAILWRVGGVTGQDEPRLANAYFLGPPLSYEGQLYSLVEINGETKLTVLDPKSGKLLWQQQLAHASTLPIQYDVQRQSQALSPTIADGIVICPTGLGAVVAVDLLSRSLRWGTTYRANNANPSGFRAGGAFGMSSMEFAPLSRRWEDAAMIADAGRIVVSPPDSEFVFCRDSLTGTPIVASHPRRNARYVAGFFGNTMILVAETGASAVSLEDKRLNWDISFPNGATLAGKGLWQGNSIMLPLSNQQVIRVRLEDGSITGSAQVDQALGNLFAYKNQILSVTSTSVSAFYTRESLSEAVESRTKQAANDPWVLNRQAQLLHADGKLDEAIEMLQSSLQLEPANADTRFLLIEFLLEGLEKDFDKYVTTANELGAVVEYGPQRIKYLQQLALGNIRAGQNLDAFKYLIEWMNDRLDSAHSGSQGSSTQVRLSDRHVTDSDTWIATSLARVYAAATPEQQAQMKLVIDASLQSVVGTMVPLRRQRQHYLQWLPDAASHTLSLVADLHGGDEHTTAEQLLQPLLYGTDQGTARTAQQLLALPAVADLRKLNPHGGDFLTADVQQLPSLVAELLSSGTVDGNHLLPKFQWNEGQVENRTTKENLYQLGRRIGLKGERFGRPDFLLSLSDSMLTVLNANGKNVGTLSFSAATSDLANNLFNRATARGGLLILETASEVVAFDIYRGLQLDRDALLWRHSLVNAAPDSTFTSASVTVPNAALGIKFLRRTTPAEIPITVGPLTPACLVIQTGTSIIGLDLLTGKRLWSLEGYDNKDVRVAADGLEIAIVNPAEAKVQIVDCRDGMTLREREYRGRWNHWFGHKAMMVEYRQEPDSSSIEIRVWNAITNETVFTKTVESYSRVAECEQRYLVVVQPAGKILYIDLETLVTTETACAVDRDLDSVALERFEHRLVVITESVRSRNRQILRTTFDIPMNGSVYAIDSATGEMLWKQPGKVFNMTFPVSQPRNSPFMVSHRFFDGNGPGPASVAIVDLRNGELVFIDSPPIVRATGFHMELFPTEQRLKLTIGDRNYELNFTTAEMAPQPVVAFGSEYRRRAIRQPANVFPPE